MKWFRVRLVFKARRLVSRSTLGLRVIKTVEGLRRSWFDGVGIRVGVGCRVPGFGWREDLLLQLRVVTPEHLTLPSEKCGEGLRVRG